MENTFNVVYYIIGGIILLFILRELLTWYLKQNKIVQQNDEIIRLLKRIANEPNEPTEPNENTYSDLLEKIKNRK